MAYIEGFVVAVPKANKELYRKHAAEAAVLFKEFGVTRMVEAWGMMCRMVRSPIFDVRLRLRPTRRLFSLGSNIPTRQPVMLQIAR